MIELLASGIVRQRIGEHWQRLRVPGELASRHLSARLRAESWFRTVGWAASPRSPRLVVYHRPGVPSKGRILEWMGYPVSYHRMDDIASLGGS